MRGPIGDVVLGAVLLAALAACSVPSAQGPDPTPVPTSAPTSAPPTPPEPTPPGSAAESTVTLGIYSGRPDPTWTLTGAETAAVLRAIDGLPEAPGTPPEQGLGYHGFTVAVGGRRISAYLGIVWAGGGGPQVLRRDPGRIVERLLLELGRTELTAGELAEVERSLAATP